MINECGSCSDTTGTVYPVINKRIKCITFNKPLAPRSTKRKKKRNYDQQLSEKRYLSYDMTGRLPFYLQSRIS